MKLKITTILLLITSVHCAAQQIRWGVAFESRFDNREYNSQYNFSKTFFGATLSPEVGINWDEKHTLMVGAHAISEFGSPTRDLRVDPAFYYNYRDKHFNISTGLVPFSQLIGSESRAFFNDSVRFFKKTIGGVLLQYVNGKNHAELYCDWDGRQSPSQREKFTIYSSGRAVHKWLFGSYELSMHHHAQTANSYDGVTDNIWINAAIGGDISRKLWFDSLTVSAGIIQTFQNDRAHVGQYVHPMGGEFILHLEKFRFGILNNLFIGSNLMPYLARYGSSLYWGDAFYSTNNRFYNRAELYWNPLRRKNFNLKVSSVHHYDGIGWSWQQFITCSVAIDQDLFKKRK